MKRVSAVPPIDRMGTLASLCVQAGAPSATQYAVTSPAGVPTRMVFSVANTRVIARSDVYAVTHDRGRVSESPSGFKLPEELHRRWRL